MSDCSAIDPRSIDEMNFAMTAVMHEVAERLNFHSKCLVTGQEDILTLAEYEALFGVDIKRCEYALDVLLDLAKQQKIYLEALISVKKFEKSLPSVVALALKRSSVEIAKASDLRKRVVEGDFSFFISNTIETETSSLNLRSSPIIAEPDLPKMSTTMATAEGEQARMTEKPPPSCSTMNVAFRIRGRPQYCSDAARRVLGEINKVEEVQKSVKSVADCLSTSNLTEKTHPHGMSAERVFSGEGKLDGKHISASGGCSLDGSIMDFGENSGQNGLRAYSPVFDIPPQPNFDESVDFFSESGVFRKRQLYAGDAMLQKSAHADEFTNPTLRSKESATSKTKELCPNQKVAATNVTSNESAWLSSSYVPRARPKFTSSIGRKFNQE